MSHVVNVVFAKEIDCYDPRARHQYFINPFAVLEDLGSLLFVHHDFPLLFNGFLVTADADNKVRVREKLFSLF